MKRREFITLLCSAAAVWPLAARAQQSGGMRRVGALMSLAENDPVSQARIAAFLQELKQLGWTVLLFVHLSAPLDVSRELV
jgi:putative tryptophan/tyrosine transport system substrate-binding protein